jgi:hypothetical protein
LKGSEELSSLKKKMKNAYDEMLAHISLSSLWALLPSELPKLYSAVLISRSFFEVFAKHASIPYVTRFAVRQKNYTLFRNYSPGGWINHVIISLALQMVTISTTEHTSSNRNISFEEDNEFRL